MPKKVGIKSIGDFMQESMGHSMNNSAVLSFLDGIAAQQNTRKRLENQVDTLWKKKCPETFEPVEGEDLMKNVIFNNVFTDAEALQHLIEQEETDIDTSIEQPQTRSPVEEGRKKLNGWVKAAAIGAGALGILGTGLGAWSLLQPKPIGADIGGVQFEVVEEFLEIEESQSEISTSTTTQ